MYRLLVLVGILYAIGKIDLTLPCSKLCEPPVEEGVEEVDVDDDVDQGQSVADKVGKGVPGKSFGILPFLQFFWVWLLTIRRSELTV